ncbi:MAG: T9SS type A sorting domain-containing protein [candidate division Zixibacteria bacterium]|nr:T9SS type A sorting domain-containing protein [candidate division Zixibacteria bacterium]
MSKVILITATLGLVFAGSVWASSPGDTVGTTYYDMQNEISAGSRIVVDSEGGYHIVWMKANAAYDNRAVYYNFIDESGSKQLGDGTSVSSTSGAGFPSVDVLSSGKAVVAYHNSNNNDVNFAKDGARGTGLFTLVDVPDTYPAHETAYWPKMAVDGNGRIHVLSTVNFGMTNWWTPFIYTYSTDNGSNWEDVALVDTLLMQSPHPVCSRTGGKTAFVYGRPRDIEADLDWYDADMYYIESADGSTWDFSSRVNVTNYQNDDTYRVWTDWDGMYDNDDNLHIIWSAIVYDYDTGNASTDSCVLFHWSSATGIDTVATALEVAYPSYWDLAIAKVNLGIDANDNLFALWTRYSASDTSDDGYSNGDLYFAYSTDNGDSWSSATNITDSQTPGCAAGDCDSDHWASMAEVVDEYLHIMYIHDTDAGAAAGSNEGDTTACQVLYYPQPNPIWVGIDEDEPIVDYELRLRNYPNPFNNSTIFEFPMTREAELSIYNIRGELVFEADASKKSSIAWDSENQGGKSLASGVYFARFTTKDYALNRRIVMVK